MTTPDDAPKPFDGIRILDFTRVLAGPFASGQLALLGADVVKIEAKSGDDLRYSGAVPGWSEPDHTPGFLSVNANKRSLTLDLKKPAGIAVVERLVRDADVVVENFRPGVMASLGIGYEQLSALNPRLIYCAVSGFGQSGPLGRAAAFDGMIQAMSGLMSITGHPETGPTRAGFAACDVISGMTAAFGLASALFQRTHTGRGQLVDVSMLDSTLNFLRMQAVEHLIAGHRHGPAGNLSVTKKPTADMYPTREGHLVLAVLTEPQFARLLRTVGREDVLADPRFRDWPSRIKESAALRAILVEALAADSADGWAARLQAADVPCGKVLRLDEILRHEQVAHRGLLQTIDSRWGELTLLGTGFRLQHGTAAVTSPPPALGEHADAILAEAGYSAAEIAELRADGAV
jgi:crotonobetainyl-CoA:carnitine CoA-transferase CaiB-like acyl-CoA transferase